MFTLGVRSNIDDVIQQMQAGGKQLPYATARAMTATAQIVKQAEIAEMGAVFDRPTPWTLNSLFVKPATKTDLTTVVWLKDARAVSRAGSAPDKYLNPEIHGGFRRDKAFEKRLQAVGALPPGWVVVPGKACPLDSYGNINPGTIRQVLSYFATNAVAGFSTNTTAKQRAKLAKGSKKRLGFVYFVGRPADGKLPLGIWQRFTFAHGSAIKPIFIFVDGASYRIRFMFQERATQTFNREFPGQFQKAWAEANATAR